MHIYILIKQYHCLQVLLYTANMTKHEFTYAKQRYLLLDTYIIFPFTMMAILEQSASASSM